MPKKDKDDDEEDGISDDPNDQVPDADEHDENPFVAGFEMFKPKKKKTKKETEKEEKENLERAAEALKTAKAGVLMLEELIAAKTPYSEYPEKAKWLVNRMGHLVFVIQNGELKSEGAAELRKGNYYYRVRSTIDGVDVVDYDKNRVKALVKDILNRAGEFLEIKMLWWVLYALALLQLTSMFGCARAGNSWDIEKAKTEIVSVVNEKCKTLPAARPSVSPTAAPSATSTGTGRTQVGTPVARPSANSEEAIFVDP